ncbi:UNVERIFIED_CONTAM: hypothetical protein FKN15_070093 [Acipenser sinensis]
MYKKPRLLQSTVHLIAESTAGEEKLANIQTFAGEIAQIMVKHIGEKLRNKPAEEARFAVEQFMQWKEEETVSIIITSGIPAILLKCLYLFVALPSNSETTEDNPEHSFQEIFTQTLLRLCSDLNCVEEMVQTRELQCLIIAMTSIWDQCCSSWRRSASLVLRAISSVQALNTVKSLQAMNCIKICTQNLAKIVDQVPPSVLAEVAVSVFSFIKDSYSTSPELSDAEMNEENGKPVEDLLNFIAHLTVCGQAELKVAICVLNPQPAGFRFDPQLTTGTTVKNLPAFRILQSAFQQSGSTYICTQILSTIKQIWTWTRANFFLLEWTLQSLSQLADSICLKPLQIHTKFFQLVEMVVFELDYIPHETLQKIQYLIKENFSTRFTMAALKCFYNLTVHVVLFNDVFSDSGLLKLLLDELRKQAKILRKASITGNKKMVNEQDVQKELTTAMLKVVTALVLRSVKHIVFLRDCGMVPYIKIFLHDQQYRLSTSCILEQLSVINPEEYMSIVIGALCSSTEGELLLKQDLLQLSMELQFAVTDHVQSLVKSERNRQIMCMSGLLHTLLTHCHTILDNTAHPLHLSILRIFEKLASQAIEHKLLRQFLRLRNPRKCAASKQKDVSYVRYQMDSHATSLVTRVKGSNADAVTTGGHGMDMMEPGTKHTISAPTSVRFMCSKLLIPGQWHHLAMVIAKDMKKTCKLSAYLNGKIIGSAKMGITSRDSTTPVYLARNLTQHLSGTARTIGAALVGHYGVRTFASNTAAKGFQFIGGPSVILGFVAMASDDSLMYAAVKVLLSVLSSSTGCEKEMKRIHGYKLKSSLLSNRIFQLILLIVGTMELGSGAVAIQNHSAFKDILCDFEIWQNAPENLDFILLTHYVDLLKSPSDGPRNAEVMHRLNVIKKLIFLLNEPSLTCEKVNIISTIMKNLLKGYFDTKDVLRLGLFLVHTLLPPSLNENVIFPENDLDVSTQDNLKSHPWTAAQTACASPGFEVLQNLLGHHVHIPQVYFLLAALFLQKPRLEVPAEKLDLDSMLQYVIENVSERQKICLCEDVAIVLLELVKIILSKPTTGTEDCWEINYPGSVMQFFCLVHNISPRQPLWSSPGFLHALADTIFPSGSPVTYLAASSQDSSVLSEASCIQETVPPQFTNPARKQVCDFMRILLMDSLINIPAKKHLHPFELLLEFSPEKATHDQRQSFQTELLEFLMDIMQMTCLEEGKSTHLARDDHKISNSTQDGKIAILVGNVAFFSKKLVEKLYTGMFVVESEKILLFITEQIVVVLEKAYSQREQIVSILYNSLNRAILYFLSRPRQSLAEKQTLARSLKVQQDQWDIIFATYNSNVNFITCLMHCLVQIKSGSCPDGFGLKGHKKHHKGIWYHFLPKKNIQTNWKHELPNALDVQSEPLKLVETTWSKLMSERRRTLEDTYKIDLFVKQGNSDSGMNISEITPLWEEIASKAWQQFIASRKKKLAKVMAVHSQQGKPYPISSSLATAMRTAHKRFVKDTECTVEDTALEIFMRCGESKFLVFQNKDQIKAFKRFCSAVPSLKGKGVTEAIINKRKNAGGEKTALHKWQKGKMSNFEYLMYLNTLAGRTYNDLMQYPVFPWIIADYDSEELIPEFFYLPDFLINSNKFEFGCMQDGTTLGDVVIPKWAKGDPREFIRLQREALESDYVSANLHLWIDLIFGFKQQGPAAVEAVNVYHPYFNGDLIDLANMKDPLKKSIILGFVSNFGQIPRQSFAIFESLADWGQCLCASCPTQSSIITAGTSTVVCVWEISISKDKLKHMKLKQLWKTEYVKTQLPAHQVEPMSPGHTAATTPEETDGQSGLRQTRKGTHRDRDDGDELSALAALSV